MGDTGQAAAEGKTGVKPKWVMENEDNKNDAQVSGEEQVFEDKGKEDKIGHLTTEEEFAEALGENVKWSNGTVDEHGFKDTDPADYHQLYNGKGYYNQQNLTKAQKAALEKYMDPNTQAGSLYNYSQNMNQALIDGTMTADQQATFNAIMGAMHNVGYNINLTRYDHGGAIDNMLAQAGITGGHAGLSIEQMKAALVGKDYTDKRILSTSYNDFKKADDPSTFTTREIKITYRVKAGAKGMMPGISNIPMKGSGKTKGDDFGEFLLAPPKGKVVDVKYNGKKARAKGGSKKNLKLNQIEIVIEIG